MLPLYSSVPGVRWPLVHFGAFQTHHICSLFLVLIQKQLFIQSIYFVYVCDSRWTRIWTSLTLGTFGEMHNAALGSAGAIRLFTWVSVSRPKHFSQ